jgi:hypothetical protein
MLHKLQHVLHVFERLLFTGSQSNSSSCNIFNRQNATIWVYRNPYVIIERFNERRFTINSWSGIIRNHIIGPIFLSTSITSARCLRFLRSHLLNVLREIIPWQSRHFIYFMHEDTSRHSNVII